MNAAIQLFAACARTARKVFIVADAVQKKHAAPCLFNLTKAIAFVTGVQVSTPPQREEVVKVVQGVSTVATWGRLTTVARMYCMQALMKACGLKESTGSCGDVEGAMTAVIQATADEAAAAGLVAPFAPVAMDCHVSCLSSIGEWRHHNALLQAGMPIIGVPVADDDGLLRLLSRGVTSSLATGGVLCSECGVQVSTVSVTCNRAEACEPNAYLCVLQRACRLNSGASGFPLSGSRHSWPSS